MAAILGTIGAWTSSTRRRRRSPCSTTTWRRGGNGCGRVLLRCATNLELRFAAAALLRATRLDAVGLAGGPAGATVTRRARAPAHRKCSVWCACVVFALKMARPAFGIYLVLACHAPAEEP